MLLAGDAHGDVLGSERPDAELDDSLIERSRSEATFPWIELDGF